MIFATLKYYLANLQDRALIVAIVMLSFSIGSVNAQGEVQLTQLPDSLIGKSLVEVFTYAEESMGVEFAYDADLMGELICEKSFEYSTIEEFLELLLKPFGLSYRALNELYLILPDTDPLVSHGENLKGGQVVTRENFPFSGRIVDRNTGEPLPYAFLRFQNTNLWTESTIDGFFSFQNVPNDTLVLAVNFMGYSLFLNRINSLPQQDAVIELLVHGFLIGQVDIITERIDPIRLDDKSDYHQINLGQIDIMSGNGQPDLFKGLQLMAGVQTEDASSSALNIRSSSEGENLVLLDGIPMYHLSHFFGIYSTINPNMMKSVRLFKSGYGTEYGNRIGGVLDLVSKDGNMKNTKVSLNLNQISVGISLQMPLKKNKTTLAIGYRQSHTNWVKSSLYKKLLNINFKQGIHDVGTVSDTPIANDADLNFYDTNLKVKHHFNGSTHLSLSLFRANDDYENTLKRSYEGNSIGQSFGVTTFDNSSWGSYGYSLKLSKQWNDDVHSLMSFRGSHYRSHYEFSDEVSELQFGSEVKRSVKSGVTNNRLEDVGFVLKNDWRQSGKLRMNFGFDFHNYTIENNEKNLFEENVVVQRLEELHDKQSVVSVFVSELFAPNKKTEIKGGIRLSKYSARRSFDVLPRLNLRKTLNDNWTLKASAGKYNQYLRKVGSEILSRNQPDEWQLANEDLPVTVSDQASIALFYTGSKWTYKVEGYLKNNVGSLLNRTQDSLQSVSGVSSELLFGNTKVRGLDFTIMYNHKEHAAWIGYSISDVDRVFGLINDGNPFDNKDNRSQDLKINYQYHINKWAFSTTYVYAAGKPYTPILGTFENELSGEQFLVYGDDYSARLPDYSRWDMRVKYSLGTDKNILKLGLGVYNLLNKKNISQITYSAYKLGNDVNSPLIIEESNLELLGISPNFSISYHIH